MAELQSLLRLLMRSVPLLSCFLKKVSLDLVRLNGNALLLVLLLNELHKSLELSASIVSALAGCHEAELPHSVKVFVTLNHHLLEEIAHSNRGLALEQHLVVLLRVFLLNFDLDASLWHADHAHLSSALDVDLLEHQAFAADDLFDEHSLFVQALLDSVGSSGVDDDLKDVASFLGDTVEHVLCIVEVLTLDKLGNLGELVD